MYVNFNRRELRAGLALNEGLDFVEALDSVRVEATPALVAEMIAAGPGEAEQGAVASRAGLGRVARAAALDAAEFVISARARARAAGEEFDIDAAIGARLPISLARAIREAGARRWLAGAGAEFAERWPTCSARKLADMPASFEMFSAAWNRLANPSRPYGSSEHEMWHLDVARMARGYSTRRYGLENINGELARRGFIALVEAGHGELPRMPNPAALRVIGRGAAWLQSWEGTYGPYKHPRISTLRLLGRLSPELRHAVMRGGLEEVSRVQRLRQMGADGLGERASLLPAEPAGQVLGLEHRPRRPGRTRQHPMDLAGPGLHPDWPLAIGAVARRLFDGETPSQIADGADNTVATEWLEEDGGKTLFPRWLILRTLAEVGITDPHGTVVSLRVALWLVEQVRRGRWAEYSDWRAGINPTTGAALRWSVRQMVYLGEVQEADIHHQSEKPYAVAGRVLRRFRRSGETYHPGHEGIRW